MDKRLLRLPKEGLIEPEDRQGLVDGDDVEGHGLPLTAPPAFGGSRGTGHGGENIPSPVDDDADEV
ncbi:MAG: hypothetical protein OEV61_04070 [Chloroflexota bacterium]|jgi:hypothetical protein|nr:hypothetical protein [Chloroflexota bacterium]MDH5243472.1 hypothetical protein [Chloroflexota bacterium]